MKDTGEGMQRLLLLFIRFYRKFLSPFKTASCRFTPTCSQYAKEAIEQYGAARGLWLAIKRLSRCHPLHPGGYDPVDEHEKEAKE